MNKTLSKLDLTTMQDDFDRLLDEIEEHELAAYATMEQDDIKSSKAIVKLQQKFNKTYHYCPELDYAVCTKEECRYCYTANQYTKA